MSKVSQQRPWRKSLSVLGALALVALASSPAAAAPVSLTFDFSLGDFIPVATVAAPSVTSITGNFTVSFDTAVTVVDTTVGLTVNSLSFPSASAVQYSYFAAEKVLSLGGAQVGASSIASETTDFVLQIDLSDLLAPALSNCGQPYFACGTATGNPAVTASAYAVAGTPGFWFATTGSLRTGNTVPEPVTLPLVGVAAAALWVARRRRAG